MPDLRQAPPPRYRVVERERRLVVIDTATGAPVRRDAGRSAGAASWWPRRVRFDGSAELTTSSLYDARGPRTVRLDPGSAAAVGWTALGVIVTVTVLASISPWLLTPLLVFANRTMRAALRGAITRWLNTVEREAG